MKGGEINEWRSTHHHHHHHHVHHGHRLHPPSIRRDSSSFSLWIAVRSGAVLWLVCVTHISVSTIAALLHLDTHIKDCHFKGHRRAMQTSVASGRLGREGSRLERVCSLRECQVYAGLPGSSLLSVLLCLRPFSSPLPQSHFFNPAGLSFNRPEKQPIIKTAWKTMERHLIMITV